MNNEVRSTKHEARAGIFRSFYSVLRTPAFQTLFAVLLLAPLFLLRPYAVTGGSMEPAYHEGQVVLIERLTPYIDVWRGEVLVLRNPHDKNVTEIKRVIGLPDETVDMGGDGITVTDTDGRSTKYETGSVIGGTGNAPYRIHLGPEDYFVLGDNRSKSSDSRTFGAVQKSDVIGRVLTTL